MPEYAVLLQMGLIGAKVGDTWRELRGDAEDAVDEFALRCRIAFTNPADLTLAYGMHRFVARDRSPCTLRRTEAEAGRNPLLDKAMVLLDDVVPIRRGSTATAPTEFTGPLQFGNGARICRNNGPFG
jgi:hypothetical protein